MVVLLVASLLADPYVFVRYERLPVKLQVHRLWNHHCYEFTGHLNGNGTFVCEEICWLNPPKSPRKSVESMDSFDESVVTSVYHQNGLFEEKSVINIPWLTREYPKGDVYEYRSGLLIPGRLSDDYEFVPDKDGIVIEFREYVYSEKARRIYNLPGKYIRLSDWLRSQSRKD